MIIHDRIDDDTLELAACLVEEDLLDQVSLTGHRRRRREREDQALTLRVRSELRAEIAGRLRAFKHRDDLTPHAALRRIAALPADQHTLHLHDAWQLAWRGWVRITAEISCTDNTVPPAARYRISLTPRGQKELETAALLEQQVQGAGGGGDARG